MKRLILAAALLAGFSFVAGAMANEKGEYLARAGDCVACHSVPGGRAFAGGLKMASPVGTLYTTNITPDPETGIGSYTLEDFDRSIRRGIARDGHRLYPAMPYPSYAKLTGSDIADLYDYFMHDVPAVRQANRANEIPPFLSPRWPLAVWNVVYTPSPGFTPDPSKDAQWNRGAYLVEGLGHCGACHSPRGTAWQEKSLDARDSSFLAGANLDDWYAPSLRANQATGLGSWSQGEIAEFLKTGHNRHAVAYGSMGDVINNSTPYLTDSDLAAIAAFLASLPATEAETAWVEDTSTAQALLSGKTDTAGAALYVSACQTCHRANGAAAPPYVPPLAGNPTVLDKDPASLINIVLNGSWPLVAKGRPDAYRMPQFREQLKDRQIAEVVSFIRGAWGNKAGAVSPQEVAALRKSTQPSSDNIVVLKMR